jgi:PAS domain S-box-containing protein
MSPAAWSITEDIAPMLGFAVALVAVLLLPVRPGGAFSKAAKWFFIASIMCYFVSAGASILGHFVTMPAEINAVMPLVELLWVPFILFGVYAMYSQQQLNDAMEARHAVARSGEMLQSVMETTPAGVVVLDNRGKITFANPEARRLLDLADGQAADMADPAWSVSVGDHRDAAEDRRNDFRDLVGPEPLVNESVTVSWPNGWRRRLLVNTTPLADDSGGRAGAVAAFVEREPWSPPRRADAGKPSGS